MGPKLLHEFCAACGTKKLRFCDSFNNTCWPVAFRQSARLWRPDELWWAAAIHQPAGLFWVGIYITAKSRLDWFIAPFCAGSLVTQLMNRKVKPDSDLVHYIV